MIRKNNIYFRIDNLLINFQLTTTNRKTGDMVQNFILPISWFETNESISKLSDKEICGDCIHSQSKNKSCYVRKGFSNVGLISKVKSIRKMGIDKIPYLNDDVLDLLKVVLKNNPIRFGAYGEAVLMGENLIKEITKVASYWTGYTHQFHKNLWSKDYFMASVETEFANKVATDLGFRTFFVSNELIYNNMVNCPASKEQNKKSTCENCKLCMGTQSKGKSVIIKKH